MQAFERSDPAAFERVSVVVPEQVNAIREAGRLSWIAGRIFDEYNAACLDELGDQGYLDLWRTYTLGQIDSPTFGALFAGAVRVFGITPRGLFKVVGQAWTLTTRGYGQVVTHVESDTRAKVSFIDLPRSGRISTVVLSMQASLGALLDAVKTEGRIEVDLDQFQSRGRVDYVVEWG